MDYLITLLGLLLLYLIWHLGARNYLLDTYRQKLFALRDELFDFARDSKKIDFDSKEYRVLRTQLNARIRFAHRLTFVDLFASKFVNKDVKEIAATIKLERSRIIKSVKDKEVRNYLKELEIKADIASAIYFIKSEPIILLSALIFMVQLIIKSLGSKTKAEYRVLTAEKIEKQYDDFWELPVVDSRSEKMRHQFATC